MVVVDGWTGEILMDDFLLYALSASSIITHCLSCNADDVLARFFLVPATALGTANSMCGPCDDRGSTRTASPSFAQPAGKTDKRHHQGAAFPDKSKIRTSILRAVVVAHCRMGMRRPRPLLPAGRPLTGPRSVTAQHSTVDDDERHPTINSPPPLLCLASKSRRQAHVSGPPLYPTLCRKFMTLTTDSTQSCAVSYRVGAAAAATIRP